MKIAGLSFSALPEAIKVIRSKSTNMNELLKANIAKHVALNENEMQQFCYLFISRSVRKKEYLLRKGEVCLYEGILRIFHDWLTHFVLKVNLASCSSDKFEINIHNALNSPKDGNSPYR